MPGFATPYDSALHAGRNAPNARAETKRKHRWIFTVFWDGALGNLQNSSVYLQTAQRPHAVTEEAVMHHDEEQVYFAGKYHWEPLSLVFYDSQDPVNTSQAIWDWFNSVVSVPNAAVALPSEYKKQCLLDMTDGSGGSIEGWQIDNCWPIDVNWNDLDYTNTEIQTVDVSMKFDRATKVS